MREHHSDEHEPIPPVAASPIRSASRARQSAAVTLVAGVAMLSGCGSGADQTTLFGAPVDVGEFEEYRDAAEQLTASGETIYKVEFDLFFNEEGLFEYFASERQPQELEPVEKSVVIRQVSTGLDLSFQRGADALAITYCVSNAFGANQAQAVQDMQNATADWQAAANFRFEYVPGSNGNCVGGAPGIDVAVIPGTVSQAACATPPYFPSSQQGSWCSGYALGTLGFDYAGWPWSGVGDATTRGIMRHELGHILGLRHEHAFAPTPVCESPSLGTDINGRPLTPYDINSVMHYPQCGNNVWGFPITSSDAEGVRQLYGMPAAWFAPMTQPLLL